MNTDSKLVVVKKYLKKNGEKNVVELIITDYDDRNYYISLIYNKRMDLFKVLYVPLDLMKSKNCEDYCCYQFIDLESVNYILETIHAEEKLCNNAKFRNEKNKNIDSYLININTFVAGKEFDFVTTQYIPKSWMFMYDVIVILFEHCPNIISEVGNEIMAVLNNTAIRVEYKSSIHFDLFNESLNDLFMGQIIKKLQVNFIEFINLKYYAIVDNHIVIIDYNKRRHILNLYCDCMKSFPGSHIYNALEAIKNSKEKKFYKLVVTENKNNFIEYTGKFKYYLCYGVNDTGVLVIHHNKEKVLPFSMFKDGLIRIGEDSNNILKDMVKEKLLLLYSKDEVLEILENINGYLPK